MQYKVAMLLIGFACASNVCMDNNVAIDLKKVARDKYDKRADSDQIKRRKERTGSQGYKKRQQGEQSEQSEQMRLYAALLATQDSCPCIP